MSPATPPQRMEHQTAAQPTIQTSQMSSPNPRHDRQAARGTRAANQARQAKALAIAEDSPNPWAAERTAERPPCAAHEPPSSGLEIRSSCLLSDRQHPHRARFDLNRLLTARASCSRPRHHAPDREAEPAACSTPNPPHPHKTARSPTTAAHTSPRTSKRLNCSPADSPSRISTTSRSKPAGASASRCGDLR
jgi:hypothetical protein